MTDEWFYQHSGRVYGPVSLHDLRTALWLRFALPTDLVRHRVTEDWAAAQTFAQLQISLHHEGDEDMKRNRHTKGFSLVELLVVISIIATLTGMLLPAVQSAREAARRMTCANNMKQVGLAFLNYESGRGMLPHTGQVRIPEQCSDNDCRGGSLYITILPFLEQQALYDMFPAANSKGWRWWYGEGFVWRPYDSTVNVWANGLSHGQMAISSFQCPSYSRWAEHPVRRDYLVMAGGKTRAGYTTHGGAYTDGLFVTNTTRRFKQVIDGLTKTIMLGEIAQPHWAGYGTGYQHPTVGGPAEWFVGQSCSQSSNCDPTSAVVDKFSSSVRFPLNKNLIRDNGAMTLDVANDIPFSSQHPGGVQFVFADGRVDFLSEFIDFASYQSLATFAGND